jgi:hypothetical protein
VSPCYGATVWETLRVSGLGHGKKKHSGRRGNTRLDPFSFSGSKPRVKLVTTRGLVFPHPNDVLVNQARGLVENR